jgi:hypothetical protein
MYDYDGRSADEITDRLRKLSQADLAKLEAYERQGEARSTVLERISALRGDSPWQGYDDMEVEDVNAALRERDGDAARRVLDYERKHRARKTIIDFAQRRREAGTKSGSSSTGRRSGKASPSKTKAKSASRPRATSSSPSPKGGRSKAGSGSRPRSGVASRPSTQSRGSSKTRSNRSGSQSRRARRPAPATAKQQVTETLQSAGGRTEKLPTETKQKVGSAAGAAGHAVGTAAEKAKGPALVTGAAVAALGAGIALTRGTKVNLRRRKRVLGVPVPRRTALGKAAKQLSQAVDSAGSAGKQLAEWSDGLQELSQRIADGKSPTSKLSRVKSPVAKLTRKSPVDKLREGKSPVDA